MYEQNEPSALFHALHRAHQRRVMEEQNARGLGDLGSPMLLMNLFHVECHGGRCSQRELATRMKLSPATVAVSLKSLERGGYVERTADSRDARKNVVSLTEKGRQAVQLCGDGFRAVDRKMLDGFTPEEEATLGAFLERMLQNLGGDRRWYGPGQSPHAKPKEES